MLSHAIQMIWKLHPSPSNVISKESIIGKHIIQTFNERAGVYAYDTKKTIVLNTENSRNEQLLKKEEKLKS